MDRLDDDPEKYINDPMVEIAWAKRAADGASIHMNLMMSMNPTELRLNKNQDTIYKRFRNYFPNLDVEFVDEKALKFDNTEKWRLFCEEFRNILDDYNTGTILRINASGIYDESNTLITTKVIFLAIEGARNIEGVNERCKINFMERQKDAQISGKQSAIL